MIELIFAIVVMGIAIMSAPMLIQRSSESSYVGLQQESIATAAVQIDVIMMAAWDHGDTNDTVGEPVLRTVSTTLNQCPSGVGYPYGVSTSSGRPCPPVGTPPAFSQATPPGSLGKEGNEIATKGYYDDIDDYNNLSYDISIYNYESISTAEGDYIDQNITVTSTVIYGDDVPTDAGGTAGSYGQTTTFSNPFRSKNISTNIKIINVTLTSNNPAAELNSKSITMSAFMCNIGAPQKILSNESSL